MTDYLLDTTVLIDLSRGSEDAAAFVDSMVDAGGSLSVSVISAMEVIAGCRDRTEVAKAESLLSSFHLMHLTPAASAQAYLLMVNYNRSHGLAIPDALIAATALVEGYVLCSDNARHFNMIPELSVEKPY